MGQKGGSRGSDPLRPLRPPSDPLYRACTGPYSPCTGPVQGLYRAIWAHMGLKPPQMGRFFSQMHVPIEDLAQIGPKWPKTGQNDRF